jgi:Transmembrane protein 43
VPSLKKYEKKSFFFFSMKTSLIFFFFVSLSVSLVRGAEPAYYGQQQQQQQQPYYEYTFDGPPPPQQQQQQQQFNNYDDFETVVEVHYESWGERLSNSIVGFGIGFVMLVVAFPVLWWNEGRAVRRSKTLAEGRGSVRSVRSVDSQDNDKLIHVSGRVEPVEAAADDMFCVRPLSALKVRRRVEMFQWVQRSSSQSRKKLGGAKETSVTYSYEKAWCTSVVDSSRFKRPQTHQNPAAMRCEAASHCAAEVRLTPGNNGGGGKGGDSFLLCGALIDMIAAFVRIPLSSADLDALPVDLRHQWTVANNYFYSGHSHMTPQIGDCRVHFEAVMPTTVSVVAKQLGSGELVPFEASSSGDIALLATGTQSADQMFASAERSSATLGWIIRFAGWLLMVFGLSLMTEPIAVLADVVPFIGTLVRLGTSTVSMLLAAFLASLTIALAWLRFRPLLALTLIALSCASIFAVAQYAQQQGQ